MCQQWQSSLLLKTHHQWWGFLCLVRRWLNLQETLAGVRALSEDFVENDYWAFKANSWNILLSYFTLVSEWVLQFWMVWWCSLFIHHCKNKFVFPLGTEMIYFSLFSFLNSFLIDSAQFWPALMFLLDYSSPVQLHANSY